MRVSELETGQNSFHSELFRSRMVAAMQTQYNENAMLKVTVMLYYDRKGDVV